MKEYIEREALIKEGWLLQRTVYGNGSATIESKQLKDIPTADVVPVVRCKECIRRDPADHKCDCGGMARQGCPFPVADDYYCAYGKRKGGDE